METLWVMGTIVVFGIINHYEGFVAGILAAAVVFGLGALKTADRRAAKR